VKGKEDSSDTKEKRTWGKKKNRRLKDVRVERTVNRKKIDKERSQIQFRSFEEKERERMTRD